MRKRRGSYKQQFENGPSRAGAANVRSPAKADRAQPDLVAALAEIAALSRAAGGNSIADGDAELAAPNHSPPPSTPGLNATAVPDRLAYTVNDAIRILSLSRSTINKIVQLNRLKSIKILGRRLITRAAIEDLLKGSEQ